MTKRIKNNDTVPHTWCGQEIQPSEYYTIQSIEMERWVSDSSLFTDIGNSIAVANDGTSDITDVNTAINFLKDLLPIETKITNIATQSTGELKVASNAREGSSTFLVSHDFCDKTTWWGESVRVTNEELSADLLHLVYSSDHDHWIDLEHGKVSYEDDMASTYKPHIYVDGEEVTSGFTINYVTGSITFSESKIGKTVTATYSYATTSGWVITPTTGRMLRMMGTEIKLTSDVELCSDQEIVFQLFVGNTVVGQVRYKSVIDLLKCTVGHSYVLPKFSCCTHDVIVLPFDYITVKDLKSSLNMKVKISLSDDNELQGEWGSISAQCLSIVE